MDKELKKKYANIAFYTVILVVWIIAMLNKANVTWWMPWAWIFISIIQIYSSCRSIRKLTKKEDMKE